MKVTRRQFLIGAGTAGGAALGDMVGVEPRFLRVSRHDVRVPDLPAPFEGLRIAHLTDVHLAGIHAAARAALDEIARDRPEVVVLTGDICDRPGELADLTEFAREARGRLATFSTFGNWEHWVGITRATAESAYGRAGVELLVNGAATVTLGGEKLSVLGLDDPVSGTPDLALARRAAAPSEAPPLLLVHAPAWVDTVRDPLGRPPFLILSGHTHGGQGRIFSFAPFLPPGSGRFVSGWYRDVFAPLYVSRGIGTSVVRARFMCPPELPIFTLRRP